MTKKSILYSCTIFPWIAEINSNVRNIPGFFPINLQLKQNVTETLPINVTYLVEKNPDLKLSHSRSFGNYYGEVNGGVLLRKFQLLVSMNPAFTQERF